jgi:hypothetical protein
MTVIDGVFEARGLLRASSAAALEVYLRRRGGIHGAEANAVSQTVTVHYDEASLTAEDVRALIERFGCSCGGEVVPCHLCRDEQPAVIGSTVRHGAARAASDEHAGHAMAVSAAPTTGAAAAPHDEHASHAMAVSAAPTTGAAAAPHDEHAGHAMAAPAAPTTGAAPARWPPRPQPGRPSTARWPRWPMAWVTAAG